ncbi:hypothetical protein BN871_BK_00110 [Paenibacillus sp. P22]|nr:hypothetical protein BN871_BK_00110 [Paenibacillus sp. P22]
MTTGQPQNEREQLEAQLNDFRTLIMLMLSSARMDPSSRKRGRTSK